MIPQIKNDHPERQFITIIVFNVPSQTVFSAWTDPELLKKWWGPKGFTNTFHEFDFRTGGRWKIVMHGPDGGHYSNESVFVEIQEPERIVLNHVSKPHFLLRVSFEEIENDTTRLIFEQVFSTVKEYNKVKKFAVDGERGEYGPP